MEENKVKSNQHSLPSSKEQKGKKKVTEATFQLMEMLRQNAITKTYRANNYLDESLTGKREKGKK